MLIDYRDVSTVRKEVDVEIPADALSERFDEVAGEFARKVKVSGFRQGKAPMSLVKKKFGSDIRSEVIERLLPVYFTEALKEKDVKPLGEPHLVNMDEFRDGSPLKFTATFEVVPEIDLQEWKGLEVTEPPREVTDEEVDQVIDNIRNRASTFAPVEGREAREGDWVSVDIESSGEGVEPRKSEDYEFELGENAPLPEIVTALVGKKPGDDVHFEKVWEPDAPNEEVAGKRVRYDIRLKAVRTLERPEVDDDLAKTGGWDTLEEMRARLREQLLHQKEHEAENQKRKQLGDQLVERHDFEVPSIMVEEELNKALQDYARYLQSQGVNLEYAEIDWMKVRDEFRTEAEARVRRMMILNAIADAESLTVSDEEVDDEIRPNVREQEFAGVRSGLRRDGTYEAIRRSLRRDKALKLVMDAAKIKKEG